MARVLLALLALLGLVYLASGFTMVRSDERAVVRRFGRIMPEKLGPGLHFDLPWGMGQVNRVLLKERTLTVGWTGKEVEEGSLTPGQLLTGDHNLVNVQAVIEYRVIEEELERFVLLEDRIEPLIARAAEAALADWMAGHEVDDVILHGKAQLPVWLRERVEEAIAPYQLGIRISLASIVLIAPPSEVAADFDAVGQEHTRKETLRNQAMIERDRQRKKADEDVKKLKLDQEAYVKEQQTAAASDAKAFLLRLEQHRRLVKDNPAYLGLYWLDEMTRAYAQMRRNGRLGVLDQYLGSDGINVTEFPLQKKR